MQYVIGLTRKQKKLKAEKRTTLDPYELTNPKPISRGGFSEIFLCKDKRTEKTYALKVINTRKMRDVKIANLLLGEVEVMLDIKNSRFSIELVDYFVLNNSLHLVLEYCNGGDLDKYVRETSRSVQHILPPDELGLVAYNVASGLRDMHSLGMMHRDIKAKNILLIKNEAGKVVDVRLCDYGLSKRVEKGNELEGTTILGTFDYFAPEMFNRMKQQLAGIAPTNKYDQRVDVWSYGILLYFTAAGKTPHEPPGSQQKVMEEHLIEPLTRPEVPEPYLQLMRTCLVYNPAERPTFDQLLLDPFFEPYKTQPKVKSS